MTFEHIALLVEKYVAKKRPLKEDKNEQQAQVVSSSVIEPEVALGGVVKLTHRNSLKYSEHKWESTSSMAIWQVERLIEINDVSDSGHCRSNVFRSARVSTPALDTDNRAVRGISHVRLLPLPFLFLWDLNKHRQSRVSEHPKTSCLQLRIP